MISQIRPAIIMLTLLTLITGVLYPLVVTGIAQLLFPAQANGSLLNNSNGKPIGSSLIGQSFNQPQYFWGRASATTPYPYNAAASSGSNLGPTNPALMTAVNERTKALNATEKTPVPVDLVTASASGLDPHISPAAAEYQLKRVAAARKMTESQLRELVNAHTETRQWFVLGEPRVNVLQLNLALDQTTH